MTDDSTVDDLESMNGVGEAIADNLRAAGYETPADVRDATVDELAEVELIGTSSAEAIQSGDAAGRRGADPTVDEHIDEVAKLAELPVSDSGVIRLAPIGWGTHQEWSRKSGEPYETYQEVWDERRGMAEKKLAEEVALNDPRFLLERAFGYTKEQTIEHEGDGMGPVTVSFAEDDDIGGGDD
jgi:hypothetical protein